jgi:hypothetical protein
VQQLFQAERTQSNSRLAEKLRDDVTGICGADELTQEKKCYSKVLQSLPRLSDENA